MQTLQYKCAWCLQLPHTSSRQHWRPRRAFLKQAFAHPSTLFATMETIPSNPLRPTATVINFPGVKWAHIPIGQRSMKNQSSSVCKPFGICILHKWGIWEGSWNIICVKHAQPQRLHAWMWTKYPEVATVCRNIKRWTAFFIIEKFISPKPYWHLNRPHTANLRAQSLSTKRFVSNLGQSIQIQILLNTIKYH